MGKVGRPRKESKQVVINKPKRKHPLIEAFDEQYLIIPWDGGYLLYDYKRECKRANAMYIGKFYISSNGDKYVFRDDRYDSKEEMIDAMDKYNATLPFAADIYDPSKSKNYMIEIAAYDYLTAIGFKHKQSVHYDGYTFSDVFGNHLCEIQLKTEFDTSKGKVVRIITTDKQEMWQEAPFIDLETCIGAINSIVASYLGVVQAQLMNGLKKLTTSRAALMITKTLDVGTLSVYTEDAKKQTIEFLEAELKRLKGE
jgi:hypothetical protein